MEQTTHTNLRTVTLACFIAVLLMAGVMIPTQQAAAQTAPITEVQRAAMLEQINQLMVLIAQLLVQLENIKEVEAKERMSVASINNMSPVSDDHHRGAELQDAKVIIVEYCDLSGPFCAHFHETMKKIISTNDDVTWVYRHFPLVALHPNSPIVAAAAECVAALKGNEAFWTFIDGYIDGNKSLADLAKLAGVNKTNYDNCMSSDMAKSAVSEDSENAIATGGQGTPWSIMVGPTGKLSPINGAQPQSALQKMIDLARIKD